MPILLILLFLASPVYAEDLLDVRYIRNYDADTITVTIPYVRAIFGKELAIRLNGLDTPEMRGACQNEKLLAYHAKEKVRQILEAGRTIDLLDVDRDKYFRVIATVLVDGLNLNEWLLHAGLAIPYDGGTKAHPWCP